MGKSMGLGWTAFGMPATLASSAVRLRGAVVDGEKVALENEGSRDASMLSAKVLSDRAATEDTYN